MTSCQSGDVGEYVVSPMTAEEAAEERRREGRRVVYRRGQYWSDGPYRGFFSPVHPMRRLEPGETTRPTLNCWCFRAALAEGHEASANATIRVHMLTDLANYSPSTLNGKRRWHLKKSRSRIQVVRILEPSILEREGYEVVVSMRQRTKWQRIPDRRNYAASLQRLFSNQRNLVLAGLTEEGRLAGYMVGYAIEDTAFYGAVFLATEHLSTDIGTALSFEFAQACRRSGDIRQVVYGLYTQEDRNLGVFKTEMGFPVVDLPARLWMVPALQRYIRWRDPGKYSRLTGCDVSVPSHDSGSR